MNSVYSGKTMTNVYSGKKWIMSIQGRNEYCLFREEMKCLFTEEMNCAYLGKNEYCLFREEMNSVYSGKKWMVLTKGRN